MPRLLRPHIPLAVRLRVAERQLLELGFVPMTQTDPRPLALQLKIALDALRVEWGAAADTKLHLDHDPPLGARKKIFKRGVHVGYDPPANDPKHLIYREAVAHRVKTNVRGEHGQHPDRVLIVKNRRLEEREAGASKSAAKVRPPKRKAKIAGRSFQQQRCCLGARCFCVNRPKPLAARKRCGNYRPTNWGRKST